MVFEELEEDFQQLPLGADAAHDVPGPQVGNARVGAGVIRIDRRRGFDKPDRDIRDGGEAVDRLGDGFGRQLLVDIGLRSDAATRSSSSGVGPYASRFRTIAVSSALLLMGVTCSRAKNGGAVLELRQ